MEKERTERNEEDLRRKKRKRRRRNDMEKEFKKAKASQKDSTPC